MKNYKAGHLVLLFACGCALAACATRSLPAFDAASSYQARTYTGQAVEPGAVTGTLPGFYVAPALPTALKPVVVEYAQNAGLNTPPLRVLHLNGRMVGIDAAGEIFTSNIPEGENPQNCSYNVEIACIVYTYDYRGNLLRKLRVPQSSAGYGYVGCDRLGGIYIASYNDESIAVYSPGASGSDSPVRTLELTNFGGAPPQVRSPIYVDVSGNIFVRGDVASVQGPSPTVSEFAANSKGSVTPIRMIRSARLFGGVQAIGKSGAIWTSNGMAVAWIYGKNLRGVVVPNSRVLLPASTNALALDSKGDIAYVTPNLCEVQVVKPGSTTPFQRIAVKKYCNFALFAVTF